MKKILSILGAIALLIGFTATSYAQSYSNGGYATLRFNTPIYSGPSINFNQVAYASSNERVYVNGCLSDYAWCDITYRNNWRGWIDSNSLMINYNSRNYSYYDYYSNNNAALFPIVTFLLGDYWSSHYRNYNWYRDRDRYNRIDWRYQNRHWNHGSHRPYVRPTPPVVRPYPNHRPPQHNHHNGNWEDRPNNHDRPNRPHNRPERPHNRPNRENSEHSERRPQPRFDKSNHHNREQK